VKSAAGYELMMARTLGFVVLAVASSFTHADFDDWQVNGSNTLRAEDIDVSGDDSASPYPVEGGQYFNEFNLNVSRQYSPYSFVRGEISGVWNESDYRSLENNFVPERVGLQVQNGDLAIPLRLDAGDYFANLTNRTIQRSLKGAQLELQPSLGNSSLAHSLILFSGTDQANWKDLEWSDNAYTGASFLTEGDWGQVSANIVYNSFNSELFDDDLEQWVYSAAYSHDLVLASEWLDVALEVSAFDGDQDTSGEDESGIGLYAEVIGRSDRFTALDYRLRYEDYDEDYTPRGGVITSNRQSGEAFVGWRYSNGIYLQGRYQSFDDSAVMGDTRENDIWGLRLTGPLLGRLMPDVTGSLQSFSQAIEAQDGSLDMDVNTLDASLSRQFNRDWGVRLHGFLRDQDDNSSTNLDEEVIELGLTLTRNFSWRDMAGNLDVGMSGRNIDATIDSSDELQPTLRFNLYGEKHSVSASWGYLDQERLPGDIATQTAGLDYSYRHKQHTFGLDLYWIDRNASGFQDTETLKAGVSWTYFFDRRSQRLPSVPRSPAEQQIEAPPLFSQQWDSTLQSGLVFNAPMAAQSTLASLEGARTVGSGKVLYQQVFAQLPESQQLVLGEDALGNLERLTVVIDPGSGSRTTQSAYTRTRNALLERYGTPDLVREEGEFVTDLAAQLIAGDFQRLMVWHTGTSTIQLGIPRRTDGRVHVEVQESAPREVRYNERIASTQLSGW